MPLKEILPCDLCGRIARVREIIAQAERRHGRPTGGVTVVAASKAQPIPRIRAAAECGLHLFGENYVQEAEPKIIALRELCWHFIGPLQANKTRKVAKLFDWVHSIDRLKIAVRLSAQRPELDTPLDVCLQVNISREPAKSGVLIENLPKLAEQVASLAHLRLRGLMAIPAPSTEAAAQRRAFAAVRMALEDLNRRGHRLDTLSMGMSGDLEAAIAEGATMVRVGTAIFGPRV
ncbi:MAG TPA: YggS family pyridoxal phosphate-dependent enzyme [Gammaproteobacteria bacterium]|nr:YggS family pyridoxal phosphate-dependent enzyme [Gammaproteobacteria bacterium]